MVIKKITDGDPWYLLDGGLNFLESWSQMLSNRVQISRPSKKEYAVIAVKLSQEDKIVERLEILMEFPRYGCALQSRLGKVRIKSRPTA